MRSYRLKHINYTIISLFLLFSISTTAKTTELYISNISISNLTTKADALLNSKTKVLFYSLTLMGQNELKNLKIGTPTSENYSSSRVAVDTSNSTPLFKRSIAIFRSDDTYNFLFNRNFWKLENIKNFINNATSKNTYPNHEEKNSVTETALFDVTIPAPASSLIKFISDVPDNLTFTARKLNLNRNALTHLPNCFIDSSLDDLFTNGSFTDSSGKKHSLTNSYIDVQMAYNFNMLFRYAIGFFIVLKLDSGFTLIIQDQYSYIKNESIDKLDSIPFVKPKSSLSNKANEEFEKNVLFTLSFKP